MHAISLQKHLLPYWLLVEILPLSTSALLTCDIFCRVVDNYGDIGVTWRLARQMASEHGVKVRLIIDDLASLQKIAPQIELDKRHTWQGVSAIIAWDRAPALDNVNIVVEGFGCTLPDAYVEEMALCPKKPLWINLEYLSAEPWVADHHLLPSPHLRHPLTKYFFFPGFQPGTGGLIREAGIQPAVQTTVDAAFKVLLFGYDSPRAVALLKAIDDTPIVTDIIVPEGALAAIAQRLQLAKLDVRPFVSQPEFDAMLCSSDILFVRGEDSFVRALYAARPFVWQIYPQAGGAHMVKLDAFLALYCRGLSIKSEQSLRAMWIAANEGAGDGVEPVWKNFLKDLPELRNHARKWQKQLLSQVDLATNLMTFYKKFLKI